MAPRAHTYEPSRGHDGLDHCYAKADRHALINWRPSRKTLIMSLVERFALGPICLPEGYQVGKVRASL